MGLLVILLWHHLEIEKTEPRDALLCDISGAPLWKWTTVLEPRLRLLLAQGDRVIEHSLGCCCQFSSGTWFILYICSNIHLACHIGSPCLPQGSRTLVRRHHPGQPQGYLDPPVGTLHQAGLLCGNLPKYTALGLRRAAWTLRWSPEGEGPSGGAALPLTPGSWCWWFAGLACTWGPGARGWVCSGGSGTACRQNHSTLCPGVPPPASSAWVPADLEKRKEKYDITQFCYKAVLKCAYMDASAGVLRSRPGANMKVL